MMIIVYSIIFLHLLFILTNELEDALFKFDEFLKKYEYSI